MKEIESMMQSTTARTLFGYIVTMIEAIYIPTDCLSDIDDDLQLFAVMYYSELEERHPERMMELVHITKRIPYTYDLLDLFCELLNRNLLDEYYEWREEYQQVINAFAEAVEIEAA